MDFICENDFIRALAVKRSLSYLIRWEWKPETAFLPKGTTKRKK